MDPISQGSLGATLAQSAVTGERKTHIKQATWMGCFGGLAPDLDILICQMVKLMDQGEPINGNDVHLELTRSAEDAADASGQGAPGRGAERGHAGAFRGLRCGDCRGVG